MLGPVYIAELAPAKWRGRLVGMFQINIVIGILLAYLSNYIITTRHLGALQWRWEFGVAIVPSVLFLIMLYGIPRSSRWLVTTNQTDEALDVLRLMGSPDSDAELKEIIESVHMERGAKQEPLFNGKYNKPILLAITIGMFNQLSGINAILYYSNSIFASAGFHDASAALQTVAVGLVNLLATFLGMALIDKLGRKTLLLIGALGMVVALVGVGAVFATQLASEPACLVPDAVHRLLRNLAGISDLGVHLGGLSIACALEGPEPWVVLSLDHERDHRLPVPADRGALTCRTVLLLRSDDGAAVLRGALCVSGDQGADAGEDPGELRHSLGKRDRLRSCVEWDGSAMPMQLTAKAGG